MATRRTRALIAVCAVSLVVPATGALPADAKSVRPAPPTFSSVDAKDWTGKKRSIGARLKSAPPETANWPDRRIEKGRVVADQWQNVSDGLELRAPDDEQVAVSVESLGRLVTAVGLGVAYDVERSDSTETGTPTPPSPSPTPESSSQSEPDGTSTPSPSATAKGDAADDAGAPEENAPADATIAPELRGTEIKISYADYENAVGGDWSRRLRLFVATDCDLGEEAEAQCEPTPLETKNDTEKKILTAVTPATASRSMTVMAAATASGTGGDYSATPLSPASSWNAGTQGGEFTWSYPVAVPPAINGPSPDLSLNYSSGSVDGRTIATNNQTSWVGEGFSLDPGAVERAYIPCSDIDDNNDGADEKQDLCWRDDNLTMSFAGHSGKLVQDGSTSQWRFKNDDGTRIQIVKTDGINADNNGEYWIATTTEGTRYYFGRNKRIDTADADANSVSTVPVMGCTSATYSADPCKQAWRWSLDYVVDAHGNSMSYTYAQETNKYGSADRTYDRGSYLTKIEYGTRRGSEHEPSPARVLFDVAERCIGSGTYCDSISSDPSHWPDVPADQICTSSCDSKKAPTFFSRKRLAKVTTQVLSADDTYSSVNEWTLKHTFPASGDGSKPSLWLDSIQQTGKVGTDISLPPTTFTGEQGANRVDKTGDGEDPFIKYRVKGIDSGMGRLTSITYSEPECTPENKPSADALDTNTKRCFPGYAQPDGYEKPRLDFYNKYVVTAVSDGDSGGFNPPTTTTYTYGGGAAWHYTDNDLQKKKYRTWDQWRGYSSVETTTGIDTVKGRSVSYYLRGMHGDKKQGGGTRSVDADDDYSPPIVDREHLAGFLRTTVNFDQDRVVDVTVNEPWVSASTATNGDDTARMVNVSEATIKTRLSDGTYRTGRTQTTYDDDGLPIEHLDAGDTSTSSDDQCTKTTYAKNRSNWMLDFPKSAVTHVGTCASSPSSAADVISATRTTYDQEAPVTGDVVQVESADGFNGGVTYQTDSTTEYDGYGRPTRVTDASGKATTTAYSPATGIPTSVTVRNPKNQESVISQNRAWGAPTSTVDVNGTRTDYTYDALGRKTAIWAPGRDKAAGQSASATFDYQLRSTQPNRVITRTLNWAGDYKTTTSLVDGMGREISTQTPAPGPNGGWLITGVLYNSRGLVTQTSGPWYTTTDPGGNLVRAQEVDYPSYSDFEYDGAGRVTKERLLSRGSAKSTTTTTYGGDRTKVVPPAGGTPTTTVTDARGQTTSLIEHTSPTATDGDVTTYKYTPAGALASYTNAAGNTWTRKYDIRGQMISETDPDRGQSTYSYDKLGRQISTTDARGKTLWTGYDELGRRTELRNDNAEGTLRAEWTYDPTGQPGGLASSTRWVGGKAYTTENTAWDSAGRITSSRVVLPESEAGLYQAGGYVTGAQYYPNGLLKRVTLPRAANLPAENFSLTYDKFDMIDTAGGYNPILTDTIYSPYGQVSRRTLGTTAGKSVYDLRDYDEATGRLVRKWATQSSGTTVVDQRIGYDLVGNITKLNDVAPGDTNQTGASTWRQCFTYDYLARLSRAWTSSGNTCATPTTSNLGSQNPYDETYTYDKSGNRTALKRVTLNSSSKAVTATSTSSYPAASAQRPHAPTQVVTATATAGTSGTSSVTESFGYDAVGSTTSRTKTSTPTTTITYDEEGHQKTATKNGVTSEYVYDADGNRLLERTGTTSRLWMGGDQLTKTVSSGTTTVVGERTYSVDGEPVATRTGASKITLHVNDHQGTPVVGVDSATTSAVSKRRYGPFGRLLRDSTTATAWPTQRNFLNQNLDSVGQTVHLGAREYDPTLGRFLTVDPVAEPDDPQQLNGYAYAENSPITFADPSGLFIPCEGARCAQYGGGGVYQPKNKAWAKQANLNLGRYVFNNTRRYFRAVTFAPAKGGSSAYASMKRDIEAGVRSGAGALVDTVGQAIANRSGIDHKFDYGSRSADWVNTLMGGNSNSVGGIIGQVMFAMIPMGPPGASAASGIARAARGASWFSRGAQAAPKSASSAIGFAEGLGKTALTPGRLQHGTKNLTKAEVLPAWSGKESPGIIERAFVPILERPTATFNHELGGTRVRGFLGNIKDRHVAVFVYKEGPYQGQLASSFVPSPTQLKMWGLP